MTAREIPSLQDIHDSVRRILDAVKDSAALIVILAAIFRD